MTTQSCAPFEVRQVQDGSPDGTLLVTDHVDHARVWRASPPARGAEIRRSSMLATLRAEPLVDSLFQELPLSEDVIDRLLHDRRLGPNARDAAVRMARARGGNADLLGAMSWQVLRSAAADTTSYRRALHWAERAHELNPLVSVFLNALGVARYRLGDLDGAVAALARSDTLSHLFTESGGHPTTLAFLAMALNEMGKHSEAQKAMARLRSLMQDPTYAADRDCERFHAEAEKHLAGTRNTATRIRRRADPESRRGSRP